MNELDLAPLTIEPATPHAAHSPQPSLSAWLRLVRVPLACLTALVPVWGALATDSDVAFDRLAILFVVGLMAHVFGFVLNDLADVRFDRQRANTIDKPLADHAISARRARMLALIQPPLAIAVSLAAFGFSISTLGLLLLSIAFAVIFNFFNKRFPIPPIMDLALGISLALMILYGALVTGTLTILPIALAILTILQIVFFKGVEVGLANLANDELAGARSTALWLGARADMGALILTRRFIAYAWMTKLAAVFVAWGAMFLLAYWEILPFEGWVAAIGFGSVGIVTLLIALNKLVSTRTVLTATTLNRLTSQQELATYALTIGVASPHLGLLTSIVLFLVPVVWYRLANFSATR